MTSLMGNEMTDLMGNEMTGLNMTGKDEAVVKFVRDM